MTDSVANFLVSRPWWATARVADDHAATQLFKWDPSRKYALLREAYDFGLSDHDVRALADSPGAILYIEPEQSILSSTVLLPGENVDHVWLSVMSGYGYTNN